MVKNEQKELDKNIPDATAVLGDFNQIQVDEFLTSDENGKTPIEQLTGQKLVVLDFAERNSSYQNGGKFLSIAVRKVGNKKTVGFNTGSGPIVEALHTLKDNGLLPAKIEIEKVKAKGSGMWYYQLKGSRQQA